MSLLLPTSLASRDASNVGTERLSAGEAQSHMNVYNGVCGAVCWNLIAGLYGAPDGAQNRIRCVFHQ